MKDFFISYTKTDEPWALGIRSWLEEAGYTVFMQDPDFHAGSNFVLKMHEGASTCRRTIAVVSPAYLESDFTPSEWAAAFVNDPKGENGTLLLVIVRLCELTGLLKAIRQIRIADMSVEDAKATLLSEVQHLQAQFPIRRKSPRKTRSAVPLPEKAAGVAIHVGETGDNCIVAAGDVNVNRPIIERTEFTPGPQHITEQQAKKIQDLIKEIAGIDEKAGKGNTYGKWQNAFKNKFGLATYRALYATDWESGLSTLRTWKALARKSIRRKDNASWRNELYGGIYAAWKALGYEKEAIYQFAFENMDLPKPITSLKDLPERKLEKLHQLVMRLKP